MVLSASYLVLCLIMYLRQDHFIFFPQPLHSDIALKASAKRHAIEITNQGTTLRGWLINRDADNLLIYYGGNAEEVSFQLSRFAQLNEQAVLLLNYRGYGESEGEPSEQALVEDALYVFDKAPELLGWQPKKISLLGRSLGSGVAVQVASQRQVDRVILVTPFASILSMAQAHYPWLPVESLLKHPFNSAKHIRKVTAPLFILLAEYDDVVPHSSSRRLLLSAQSPIQSHIITNSNHVTISDSPEFISLVRSFISQ